MNAKPFKFTFPSGVHRCQPKKRRKCQSQRFGRSREMRLTFLLVTCYLLLLLVTVAFLLVTLYFLLITRYFLLVIRYFLLVTHYLSTRYSLLFYWLLFTPYFLFVTYNTFQFCKTLNISVFIFAPSAQLLYSL